MMLVKVSMLAEVSDDAGVAELVAHVVGGAPARVLALHAEQALRPGADAREPEALEVERAVG
jgi:hypothetical protein